MKTIHRISIALGLSLAVLFLTMGSAAADIVEIRGPFGDGTKLTLDASKFATFYYNIDNNVITEALYIENI